jgi:hypothetical protein
MNGRQAKQPLCYHSGTFPLSQAEQGVRPPMSIDVLRVRRDRFRVIDWRQRDRVRSQISSSAAGGL